MHGAPANPGRQHTAPARPRAPRLGRKVECNPQQWEWRNKVEREGGIFPQQLRGRPDPPGLRRSCGAARFALLPVRECIALTLTASPSFQLNTQRPLFSPFFPTATYLRTRFPDSFQSGGTGCSPHSHASPLPDSRSVGLGEGRCGRRQLTGFESRRHVLWDTPLGLRALPWRLPVS